jgi:hypothetical protein
MIVEKFTAIALKHLRDRRTCADSPNCGFAICHLQKNTTDPELQDQIKYSTATADIKRKLHLQRPVGPNV